MLLLNYYESDTVKTDVDISISSIPRISIPNIRGGICSFKSDSILFRKIIDIVRLSIFHDFDSQTNCKDSWIRQ